MPKHCLTLNLINNPALIEEYEQHHKNVWPGVLQSIRGSGIINMEIYRFGTRLFMIMETDDTFSFDRKAAMDTANPEVQQWETLMLKYQQPFEGSAQKWVLMDKIFQL